jgi:hypothetical protein
LTFVEDVVVSAYKNEIVRSEKAAARAKRFMARIIAVRTGGVADGRDVEEEEEEVEGTADEDGYERPGFKQAGAPIFDRILRQCDEFGKAT